MEVLGQEKGKSLERYWTKINNNNLNINYFRETGINIVEYTGHHSEVNEIIKFICQTESAVEIDINQASTSDR
jgi:hypothetical protein